VRSEAIGEQQHTRRPVLDLLRDDGSEAAILLVKNFGKAIERNRVSSVEQRADVGRDRVVEEEARLATFAHEELAAKPHDAFAWLSRWP
jgi:hypothetical protein